MITKIFFDYHLQEFLQGDFTQHYGSCLSYQKVEQADVHKQQGISFPDSYHEDNTRLQQIWWNEDQIDFDELGKILNVDVKTVSAILQPPGNIVTMHRDTFFKFKNLYPQDDRLKVRANIYLEDWKPGHFLNYQDDDYNWQTSTHWKAGDGFLWDSDNLHLSANAGLAPKYTLQISGFFKK